MTSTSTFDPVERRTVSSEIRQRLLDAIRTGELIPGAVLPPERSLCQDFGVARTSVREAIQGLVTAGFLERRGNRAVVAERFPSLELVLDDRKAAVRQLFEVRRIIEPAMAELAARRADDEQRRTLSALAATTPTSLDDFRMLDREFHATIAQACANPMLSEVYSKALAALFGSGDLAALLYAEVNRKEVGSIIRSATVAHRRIASALVCGDQRRTVSAVVGHLDDVERRMVERLL